MIHNRSNNYHSTKLGHDQYIYGWSEWSLEVRKTNTSNECVNLNGTKIPVMMKYVPLSLWSYYDNL